MRRRAVRTWLMAAAVSGMSFAVVELAVVHRAGATTVGSGPRATELSSPAPRDDAAVDAPVYDSDAPDPDVIRVGTTYYAYTTGSGLRNIPVLESADLQTWQLVGDALPALPAWSAWGQTWAPGVVQLDGQFVMYYATEVAGTGQECISVAAAAVPTGPFTDASAGPLVCQGSLGGSIDPDPFVDTDGTPFLYWKSNGGTSSVPATVWAAELSPDGTTLATGPQAVLTQDQGWESTVESPAMVDVAGAYVLFYSGGLWNSAGYGVSYADCDGPLGPCRKPLDGPVLHSDSHRLGPGGEAVVQDAAGNWWMTYDAWDGPASTYAYGQGGYRSMWMAPVTFVGGTPAIDAGEEGEGYHLFARDGGVFAFGGAGFSGSMGGVRLAAPVVAGAAGAGGLGYREIGADGGVFAFGGAGFAGSMGGRRLAAPIVGMAPSPGGAGYWLVAADGGVFAFGGAGFFGSMGGRHLSSPVVAMAAMPQGGGYWLVTAAGAVAAFGNAEDFGSTAAQRLAAPVVAIVPGPGSGGYWLVAADGGVFAFGDSQFLGSAGGVRLAAPVVAGAA